MIRTNGRQRTSLDFPQFHALSHSDAQRLVLFFDHTVAMAIQTASASRAKSLRNDPVEAYDTEKNSREFFSLA